MRLGYNKQWQSLFMVCLMWGGLCAAGCVMAGDLRNYAVRLKHTQFVLEAIRQREDGETDALYARRVQETLTFARRELPSQETIDTPAGALPLDNKWLEEALQEYAALDADTTEADASLENIALRLAALRERVEDDRRAVGTAPETPETAKARLERIMRRTEYGGADPQGNALVRLIDRIKKFVKGLLPQRAVPLNDDQAKRASPYTQLLVYALLLAAMGLAAWRILPLLKISRARRRKAKVKAQTRVVLGETLEAHQTAQDIFAEAELLARNGEWQPAIRKGYIAALCALSDSKLVRLEEHKTNRDYLREVAGQETLARPLGQITNRFEYHWYGLAPADAQAWHDFRAGYLQIRAASDGI